LLEFIRGYAGPTDSSTTRVFEQIELIRFDDEDRFLILQLAEPTRWNDTTHRGRLTNLDLADFDSWARLALNHEPASQLSKTHDWMFEEAPRLCLRVAISNLGPSHASFIPRLVTIARTTNTDAGVLVDISNATRRIGHISAEPLLLEIAQKPLEASSRHAIETLATLGTRASLGTLAQIREDRPALARDASKTIDAIMESFPAAAGQGALSMVDKDDIAGALTLAGASDGDLELYRRVHDLVSINAVDRDTDYELIDELDIYLVAPAPRRVSTRTRMHQAIFHSGNELDGPFGMVLFMAALVFMGLLVPMSYRPVFAVAAIILVVSMDLRASMTFSRRMRAIEHGLATHVQFTARSRHEFTFSYVDHDGRVQSVTRVSKEGSSDLTSSDARPALVLEDDVVFFDELQGLKVGPDGTLESPHTWVLFVFVIYPLFVTIATYVFIAPFFL